MLSSYELRKKGYTCPDILSTCCMYDCSSLKFKHCIQKCCCFCCPGILVHDSNQTFPHIEYGRIESLSEDKEKSDNEDGCSTNTESVTTVPYQRIFQYPQPQGQFPIHPQLDNKVEELCSPSSVVRQQPTVKGHSDSTKEGEKCGLSDVGMTEQKQLWDYSPYGGSMDDIDADIGYIDMTESSAYVESNFTDSLHIPQRCTSSPVMSKARPRSPSPIPSLSCLSDVGTELRKRSAQLIRQPSHDTPYVHFSLYYNESNQKLIVHLSKVSKLPTSRPEESSNPFIEIYLLPKKKEVHKSHTEMKTHNPTFDETFKFTELNQHEIKKQTVVMRIYNNERNHFIGGVLYPLESADMNGNLIKVSISEFDEEESLRGSCCGDILLSVCYHSKSKALEIIVIEINNLKKSDFIGMSNPYVKVNMMQQDQRLVKWKTTVKRNTLMPVFYESTSIDIGAVDSSNIHFDVLIMDYDRVGRNCILGLVKLGYSVGHASGEKQWQQVLNNPNKTFSTWHCIKPIEKGKLSSPSHRRSKSPSCISVGYQI